MPRTIPFLLAARQTKLCPLLDETPLGKTSPQCQTRIPDAACSSRDATNRKGASGTKEIKFKGKIQQEEPPRQLSRGCSDIPEVDRIFPEVNRMRAPRGRRKPIARAHKSMNIMVL